MVQIDISVIIVNWNSGQYLEQCTASLSCLPDPVNRETIVVDNASDDGSADFLAPAADERCILLGNPDNRGFAAACNAGAEKAKGRFLLFLNPDARLETGALTACLDAFAREPDCGVLGGKVLNNDGSFQKPCRRRFPTPKRSLARFLAFHKLNRRLPESLEYEISDQDIDQTMLVDAVSGSCLAIRTELFRELEGFDDSFFLYGEDLDLCYRVRQAGWQVRYEPSLVAVHHRGRSRVQVPLRSVHQAHRSMNRFFTKHYATAYPLWFRGLVRSGIALRCLIMSALVLALRSHRRRFLGVGPGE